MSFYFQTESSSKQDKNRYSVYDKKHIQNNIEMTKEMSNC